MGIQSFGFSDIYGLLIQAHHAPEMYRTGRKLPEEQQTKEVYNDRNKSAERRYTGQASSDRDDKIPNKPERRYIT